MTRSIRIRAVSFPLVVFIENIQFQMFVDVGSVRYLPGNTHIAQHTVHIIGTQLIKQFCHKCAISRSARTQHIKSEHITINPLTIPHTRTHPTFSHHHDSLTGKYSLRTLSHSPCEAAAFIIKPPAAAAQSIARRRLHSSAAASHHTINK